MVLRRAVLAALLLLWPATVWAQLFPIPNTAVHVICDAGTCGGGSAFNDGSTFTGGSTPVNIFAGVFDDALADATSGTAVAARLTNKRALHINLRDAAGAELGTVANPLHVTGGAGGGGGDGAILDGVTSSIKATVTGANALKVDGSAVTQPVSGTFWQATQPVSGPLTDTQLRASAVPVSGTFWQTTQPVSGTFWQTTQPVSGTFWQATQPVSGTVTANQGTANTAANGWPVKLTDGTDSANVTGTSLDVNCTGGCGGAASFSDNSAFTAGTTAVNVSGGVFNDGLAAVTSGNAAAPRITTQRGLHVNLRNNAGTEIGTSSTPVRIDPTGTTSQPQIGAEANVGSASWTSATGSNTDVQVVSTGYSVGVTQITTSGVLSAGAITLEGSTDNGTTWKALLHYSPDFSCSLCSSFVSKVQNIWNLDLNVGNGTQYVASLGGYSKYRARLSTVLTGSGTVTVRIFVTSADPGYQAVYAPQVLPALVTDGTNAAVITNSAPGAVYGLVSRPAVSYSQGVSDSTTQRMVLAQEATYSAGTTVKTATAAGTGPFFSICGSASKTVRIQRFIVSGTANTASYGDLVIKRTSTATSGGTATSLTRLPYDSTSAAASVAAPNYYTVLATAGTSVGVIANATMVLAANTYSATEPKIPPQIFVWRDQDSEAPTLRGTAQCMEANFGATPGGAPSLTLSVVWTEK